MRIEENYYGDFKVVDELPFDLFALSTASNKIWGQTGKSVSSWPVTIDYNEKTEYWEVWFTRPVSDQEYVEKMLSLPEDV